MMTKGSSVRRRLLGTALGLGLAWLTGATVAAAGDTARQAEEGALKAAYLYHFLFFSQITEAREGRQDAVIVLLGAERLAPRFDAVLNQPVGAGGGRLVVRTASSYRPELSVSACRIFYLGADQASYWPEIRKRLAGRPILTVSDSPGFIDQGGMIGLVRVEGRLRWEINRTAAELAGIALSSQLLRNAVRVVGDAPPDQPERNP